MKTPTRDRRPRPTPQENTPKPPPPPTEPTIEDHDDQHDDIKPKPAIESLPVDLKKAPYILAQATKFINMDVKTYRDIITEYGSNARTYYHLIDRLLKKIEKAFRDNFPTLELICKGLFENGDLDLSGIDLDTSDEMLLADLEKFEKFLEGVKEPSAVDPADYAKETFQYIKDIQQMSSNLNELNRKHKQSEFELPKEARKNLERLANICNRQVFVIVVIGLEKSGKSTLINFFIGSNLLPTSINRCTYVRTTLRSSETNETHVQITFFSPEELHDNLVKLRDAAHNEKDIPSTQDELHMVQELLSLGSSKEFRGSMETIKQNLNDWVANKQRMHLIKQCIVYTPALKSRVPIEIQDVPGYDSPNDYMREMTRDAVYEADAFIFVHNAGKPDQTRDGLKLLGELKRHGADNIYSKGFAILTHLDVLTNKADYVNAKETCMRELQNVGFNADHIFEGCPIYTLLSKSSNKLSEQEEQTLTTLDARRKQFPFIKSGMEKAKEAIDKFVVEDLPHSRSSEAESIGLLTRKNAKQTVDQLRQKLPNKNLSQEILKAQKWSLLWQKLKEICLKRANQWIFYNISACKDDFPTDIVDSFNKYFGEVYNLDESFSDNLAEEVPTATAYLGLADVWAIELNKRADLFQYHLKVTEEKSGLIANAIYQLLQQYEGELLFPFRKVKDFPFSLSSVVTLADCKTQVETLVMRVAYPAAHAIILWPRTHQQRPSAMDELMKSAPEVIITEEHA